MQSRTSLQPVMVPFAGMAMDSAPTTWCAATASQRVAAGVGATGGRRFTSRSCTGDSLKLPAFGLRAWVVETQLDGSLPTQPVGHPIQPGCIVCGSGMANGGQRACSSHDASSNSFASCADDEIASTDSRVFSFLRSSRRISPRFKLTSSIRPTSSPWSRAY